MDEIRERLAVHRQDALILLQETTRTATLYEGFRLAGAVGHLARAQMLLAEELNNLSAGSKRDEAIPEEGKDRTAALNGDATPVDGISLTPRPERTSS